MGSCIRLIQLVNKFYVTNGTGPKYTCLREEYVRNVGFT